MTPTSIRELTRFAPTPQAQALRSTATIAPHVLEAHKDLVSKTFPDPVVLAYTAPVSPGTALAAWAASEEARTTPPPTRKGWSYSVGTHGFKSFRVKFTRHF